MISINYRKLISFSKGSFIVTLPKAWIENNRLQKGDAIAIQEDVNSLTFYAREKEPQHKDKMLVIDVTNKSLPLIKSEIVSSYLNNYNTIEITSKTLGSNATAIKDILRNLSGMEIIEQTGSKIVAKDLIDINSISIDNIIVRMDMITRSIIEDTKQCMNGSMEPKSIVHRDADVNRLYCLGLRVIRNAVTDPLLMKKLNSTIPKLYSHNRIIDLIEEIADRQKRICELLYQADFKGKLLKESDEIKEKLRQMYNDAMKAYYNHDKNMALDIELKKAAISEQCDRLLDHISTDICAHCNSKFVKISRSGKNRDYPFAKKQAATAKIVEYIKLSIRHVGDIARLVLIDS